MASTCHPTLSSSNCITHQTNPHRPSRDFREGLPLLWASRRSSLGAVSTQFHERLHGLHGTLHRAPWNHDPDVPSVEVQSKSDGIKNQEEASRCPAAMFQCPVI
jgi:hypothetical protein